MKGPRQVGKTSLLARGLQHAREQRRQVVLTDFQTLTPEQLASTESLFLALAWMYREDYARAGIQMLPPSDFEGRFTSREILVFTVALLPVSVLPVFMGHAGLIYFCGAMALGLFFLHSGARLAISRSKLLARRLLLASIIYLPVVFGLMMVDRII